MRRKSIGLLAAATLALVALVATNTAGAKQKQHGVSGTITIIAKWTGGEQDSFMAVLAPFKKQNPSIKVKYTPGGDNTPQLVSTAVAGGNPPDIAVLPQPGLMRDLAKSGAAKPITFAKANIAKNFAPVWSTLGSVNGKLYALFFKGANKSTVWYSTKAFKNAGVKPPTIFDVSPTIWPIVLSAAFTEGSVHLIECVVSWSYFAGPAWYR
jgi:ABC-type glycerol-3-phosphate transport system substrate-binding protein